MANDLTDLIPQIHIRVLDVARENAIMPMAVTNDYSTEAASKGDTIKINVPNDHTAAAITPSPQIPAANNDVDPVNTDLVMSQWYGASAQFTEKDMREIVEQGKSKTIDGLVRAVVNQIDMNVLSNYVKVFNTTGTAGTTPFASDTVPVKNANRFLSTGRAPKNGMRNMVTDEFAYSNATDLPKFQDQSAFGDSAVIREARVPFTLGFNWWEDQNMPTHSSTATGTYAIDAAGAIGDSTVTIDNGSGALPAAMVVGDVFTIAGSTQQYAVTSYTPGATEAVVGIVPNLDQAVADGDAVTLVENNNATINLAFHPEAFHLAVRPTNQLGLGQQGRMVYPTQLVSDPISGLNLTLKFFEGYHQTLIEVSALWGSACARPSYAARILG